jgi:hypothetical protein
MSWIELTIAPIEEALAITLSVMSITFGKADLDAENQLSDFFDLLRDDVYVLIETPYVDRVYRNTYYSYFSSKHNPYPRDCIRLTFFDRKIIPSDFRVHARRSSLQNAFMGFMVLRPTFPNVIGRTLINPRAYASQDFQICRYVTNVSVNGVKLNVEGFPFSSQDSEAISCAETTIWSIMEYFGGRYSEYRIVYPSTILEVLNIHSKRRLIPSNGLTVDQISIALKEFGFGTQIYALDETDETEIHNLISVYIESGIPLVAAIENDMVGHAIVIIGHENDPKVQFNKAPHRTMKMHGKQKKYIDYGDLKKKFIVNDDNLSPYIAVSLENPVEHYSTSSDFVGAKITSVIVPLYRKIYLDVLVAKRLALEILADSYFGYDFEQDFVFRFFLTSSRSFKDHLSKSEKMHAEIKNYLILSAMPKFIWCAEFYFKAGFNKQTAVGLIIIDATEADEVWMDSLIFAGYRDRCLFKVDKKFINLPRKFIGYSKYISNLA